MNQVTRAAALPNASIGLPSRAPHAGLVGRVLSDRAGRHDRNRDQRVLARGAHTRPAGARRALDLLLGLAFLQAGLGISTLLLVVPIPLAALHQAGAVALLTVALLAAHALRRGGIHAGSDGDSEGGQTRMFARDRL